MSSRRTSTLRDYPTTRDVSVDEEMIARPAAWSAGEMSLAELKARQRRLAEDFDRRAATARG